MRRRRDVRGAENHIVVRPWAATLDVIREVVTTLTEIERTARRVLGDGHPTTVNIARFLQIALRDLHNAVETLAETERSTRRVLGSAHPVTAGIYVELRDVQAVLRDRLVFLYDVELNARSSS